MSTQRSALLIFFLLIFSTQSNSLQLVQFKTLISLSRSLLIRVSSARSARGDAAGSDRAAAFADSLCLLRFLGGAASGGGIWAFGWDFVRNYAWRLSFASATEISLAAAELADVLAEAAMSGPDKDWVIRNYDRVFRLADSLLRSLLKAFSKAGPLREAVLVLQREVVEGELLKDCLEVGARDLDRLFKIARDLFLSEDSGNGEL